MHKLREKEEKLTVSSKHEITSFNILIYVVVYKQ